ncbi:MAG: hypothetical protein IPL79_15085 [Myxococcales bacterium]|nr:hypothetical protein [Myxococcales bacterium]
MRTSYLATWSAIAAIFTMAAGCTNGPGEPFGAIEGQFHAQWQMLPERDEGDGWQRLASDFEVKLDDVGLTLQALALLPGAEAALAFDPAAPPPGYSLCHNGHCHAADGRLVSYEDISAELTGGAPAKPLVTWPLAPVDALAGESFVLACDGAPCDLPLGSLGKVTLTTNGLALAGRVRDGREPARLAEQAFVVTLELPDGGSKTTVDGGLPIDRANAPQIAFLASLAPTAALLDDINWLALTGEPLDLASDPNGAAALAEGLSATPLVFTSIRTN